MDKSCFECVYHEKGEYSGYVCAYPVPAYIQIRGSSGNFISGYEAKSCALYKTKKEIAKEKLEEMHKD